MMHPLRDRPPRRIAVAGLGDRGWHQLERLSLRDDVQVIGVWDAESRLCNQARDAGYPGTETLAELVQRPEVAGVVLSVDLCDREECVADCLMAGKHVLVEPPLAPSLALAARLYDLAERYDVCCWAASPRRWEGDLLAAKQALQSGRFGALHAVRYASVEWAPWAQIADPPPDEEPRSTAELLVPHVLDQLGELVATEVVDVWVRPFPVEDGLLAILTFADGAVAQLDLRRRSHVALQTGWLLEGDRGGYRGQKLITPTVEGELVDETLQPEPPPRDPLLSEWFARCERGAMLNERQRGEQLARLCERLRLASAEN
jgi:predicted dehydrogenase